MSARAPLCPPGSTLCDHDPACRPAHPGPKRRGAFRSCSQLLGHGFDADAVKPQQNDISTLSISNVHGRRPRSPSKFLDRARLRLQSLDRPSRQISSRRCSTQRFNLSRYLRGRTLGPEYREAPLVRALLSSCSVTVPESQPLPLFRQPICCRYVRHPTAARSVAGASADRTWS